MGLTEFGPGNVIYHEGRKHRIDSAVLPPTGIEERLKRARLCRVCGYAHSDEAVNIDVCEHCATPLDADTMDLPQRLLDQPTMRTRSVERISSDEEVRVRSGYKTTTHFRFAAGTRTSHVQIVDPAGTPVLDVRNAPAATLWRINHGWRQGEHKGFQIDPLTGRWQRRDVDTSPGDEDDPDIPQPLTGVKPFVTDNRNLLLLRPLTDASGDAFLTTLLYALKRGIQFVHQVEEQEVAAELIGRDANRRLLLWEAAEGGTGVWERLVEPGAFAEVAKQALRVCHYDPDTGREEPGHDNRRCAVACYECLLSYANQPEHRHLDRRLVRDFLVRLAGGTTNEVTQLRSQDQQYSLLRNVVSDERSPLALEFLDFLYRGGYAMPDAAENRPEPGIAVQPDFYYDRDGIPGACVFVDGAAYHDDPARKQHDDEVRGALEDRGYRVIVIRRHPSFETQVAGFPDVFGNPPVSV